MVVVQDAETVAVGQRGDEQIDRREAVVADAGELALGVERALLDGVVDREAREGEQFVEEGVVVARVARGVARLQQERQARGDPAGLEGVGELARAFVGEGGAARRTQAELSIKRRPVTGADPTGAADLVRGGRVDREVAAADAVGQVGRGGRRRPRARPAAGELLLGAEDHSSPSSICGRRRARRAARPAPRGRAASR